MAVRILPVHFIAVKHKRRPRLELAAHDAFHHFDRRHFFFRQPWFVDALPIFLPKAAAPFFLIIKVFQTNPHHLPHFMRVKQIPVAALFHLLHEQVRDANAGEQIMRPQPFTAVVEPRIEKRENVFMPYIQIDGNGLFALP